MSKLENISALLVATNSAFTKEAAFTTKTTRAELIRMLQATDFAVSEALEVAENYVKVSDQLFEDKENLQEKCSGLEAKLVTTDQQLADCSLKTQELESKLKREASAVERRKFRVSELETKLADANTSNQEIQLKLVDANKRLKSGEASLMNLEYQVHKYKQQGFFDRLFGRTPK